MRLVSHLAQIKQYLCAFINAAERFFTTAPGTAFLQPLALFGLRCAQLISVLWPVLPLVLTGPKSSPRTLWRSLGSCWLWAGSCQGTWESHTSLPPSSQTAETLQPDPREIPKDSKGSQRDSKGFQDHPARGQETLEPWWLQSQ